MTPIPEDLTARFEFLNYGHALEILSDAFPTEWKEIQDSLRGLAISIDELMKSGGNKTAVPKKFDSFLYPLGWREIRITGDLILKLYPRTIGQRKGRSKKEKYEEKCIEGFIDGHNIDYLKNRVAFDLEWNSKDQTFDRDLLAMRTYFECGLIDVGVIVTRAENLNNVFKELNIWSKYGASTTWMGKLQYRLDSRRNGGCPILAVGITKACIEGYKDE